MALPRPGWGGVWESKEASPCYLIRGRIEGSQRKAWAVKSASGSLSHLSHLYPQKVESFAAKGKSGLVCLLSKVLAAFFILAQ